jgi:triosephosphate isomerase
MLLKYWPHFFLPSGFCFRVSFLVCLARIVPAEAGCTKQKMLTSLGFVPFAELFKNVQPKQAGCPVFDTAAGNDIFGLLGLERRNDRLTFLCGKYPVTVVFSFVLEGRNTVFEVPAFQPFGVILRVAGERTVCSIDEQQHSHGAPGGCAIAQLFLVLFELGYLCLVHQQLVWQGVRIVASENVWSIAAQNFDIYDHDGRDPFARTGSISMEQIAKTGLDGVILGHPETRDTPDVVRLKFLTLVSRAGQEKTNPLGKITLMVGESWEQFQGHSKEEIADLNANQVMMILKDIPLEYIQNLVIGYDPKWGSKGSGHDDVPPPTAELVSSVCRGIRVALAGTFGNEVSNNIPLIYGGRSTPERTKEILSDSNIDGLILGSACDTVEKTMAIADAMTEAKAGARKVLHANFKAYNLSDSYADYVSALRLLDDSFIIYLSPCYVDLRMVKELLNHE